MIKKIPKYLNSYEDVSPLVIFRILFGFIMLVSLVRFWNNGWIESIYIDPEFHFKYYGFEWINSLGEFNYLLFIICGLSSICIMIGYRYVYACIFFFISFTYIELIDKTTYLNHYYFISVVSFLMIFLPANIYFSIDSYRKKEFYQTKKWHIDTIKFLLLIVYFYAGIAKINSDWLLKAVPLSIWLPGKYDLPLIGHIMSETWVHYLMSWGGMLYDLLIGFLLFSKRFRNIAFLLVIIFHVMTYIFFPSIGMFPFVMIFSTTIFLSSKIHNKIIIRIKKILKLRHNKEIEKKLSNNKICMSIVSFVLILQILIPLRYLIYDGELFWHEQGYRFSWRVMLMEKSGHSTFTVIDKETNQRVVVSNDNFLTPFQEKQMSFQPDLILEYAHYLKNHYKKKGFKNPSVYVDSFVTLNGRLSKRFIKKNTDLAKEKDSFKQKNWITHLKDEIKGF